MAISPLLAINTFLIIFFLYNEGLYLWHENQSSQFLDMHNTIDHDRLDVNMGFEGYFGASLHNGMKLSCCTNT